MAGIEPKTIAEIGERNHISTISKALIFLYFFGLGGKSIKVIKVEITKPIQAKAKIIFANLGALKPITVFEK
jgi:hypothetical protein